MALAPQMRQQLILVVVLWYLAIAILGGCSWRISQDPDIDSKYTVLLPLIKVVEPSFSLPDGADSAAVMEKAGIAGEATLDTEQARLVSEQEASSVRDALAVALSAQARLVAADALEQALLLALEAVSVHSARGELPNPVAEQSLRDLLGEEGERRLIGHVGPVSAVAFSADGRWLASAGDDATVRLWELGEFVSETHILRGHGDKVTDLAFSPDSQLLASASRDQTVRLWNMADPGREATILAGHEDWVMDLEFSADGAWLASASDDTTVKVWSVVDFTAQPATLAGHENWVRVLDFSADGRLLAAAGRDDAVRVWHMYRPERPPDVLLGNGGPIHAIRFSGDGQWLVSAGDNGAALLWDVAHLEQNPTALRHQPSSLADAVFSPDNRLLATASGDQTIRVWHVSDPGAMPELVDVTGDRVATLSFGHGGQRLAAAAADSVLIWKLADLAGGAVRLRQAAGTVRAFSLSPDGRWLATAGSDSTVYLWELPPRNLAAAACAEAGRNFTLEEWRFFFAGQEYRTTCPDLPVHPTVAQYYVERGIQLARHQDDPQAALAQFELATSIDSTLTLQQIVDRQQAADQAIEDSQSKPNAKFGIDPLHPVNIIDGALSPIMWDPNIVANTGAGWVRLNFVLGPWSSVTDRTHYHGLTWEETYHAIIEGYRHKGIKIYALISYEATPTDPGDQLRNAPPDGSVSTPWMDNYVETLELILQRFAAEIDVVETVNEPDDWHQGHGNWIHPGWFAVLQQRVYDVVKRDRALRHITVVSGPLQGLETNDNGAARYLLRFYTEGKRRLGWGQDGVPYPFDGIGYHLYMRDLFYVDPPQQDQAVENVYRRYVDEMQRVVIANEGEPRPLFISEVGWPSRSNDERLQARNLYTVLSMIADDPLVALGFWFAIQDFEVHAEEQTYGLYRQGALIPANRKPAYATFKAVMGGERRK